jgi:hypothetical protein
MIPTFACVLRSGGDFYPEHVQELARQVRENTTIDHEFVCYSDTAIDGVKTIPLLGDAPGWWAVPEVFRQKGPTIVTGIDTIIHDNIDGLFKVALDSGPEDFWMIKAFNPKNDYASGIMAYNGDWSCIYKSFDYSRVRRYRGGEQEHTKMVLRKKRVTPKILQSVFPGIVSYKRDCRKGIPEGTTVILFHGLPRPWDTPLWKKSEVSYGRIEEMWPESTAFILGGGPSIAHHDLRILREKKVIGVNQAYKITDCEVQVTYSGDRRWYNWNINKLPKYRGILYTSYPDFVPNRRYVPVNVGRISRHGISDKSRSSICWNGNSGASAINVAYWLGARRIVLLGFDMGRIGRRWNWHTDYPKVPHIDPTTGRARQKSPYRRFLECWDQIAIDAKRLGLEILNATPAGNLHKFPRVKLEDMV